MQVYNDIIKQVKGLLEKKSPIQSCKSERVKWKMNSENELIFQKDTAIELAPKEQPGVSMTLLSTDDYVGVSDTIHVIGQDLGTLSGKVPYGKVVLIKLKASQESDTYDCVRRLERVRFAVKPEGYMLRASTEKNRETVRISKTAQKKGFSLEILGNALIQSYKEDPLVEKVQVFFITEDKTLIKSLVTYADKAQKITAAMNHAFDNIEFNCDTCHFSDICDEIEDIKQMHKK